MDGSERAGSNLEMMLAANRQFVARGRPESLAGDPARNLAVLTCADPRLSGMWQEALGLKRGDALVLRNAGATLAANDDVLRSLAVAVYAKGCTEVLVLGHTDCGMTKIETGPFVDAMAKAGIPRDAVPSMDIREWLGAFAREDDSVRETVRAIRSSGLFPADMPVYGLVIDVETGEVRIVE